MDANRVSVAVLVGVLAVGAWFIFKGLTSPPAKVEPGLSADNSLFNSSLPPASPQEVKRQPPATAKPQYGKAPNLYAPDQLRGRKMVLQTDKGTIEIEIYPEATAAASNIIFLTEAHFYDGLTFHRVEPGFVVQGGDPNGNGTGGPGYTMVEKNIIGRYDKGVVAMAKRADEPAGTLGSQFFIMLEDAPRLPPDYAVVGKVISGQDVVSKIRIGDRIRKAVIEPPV